MLMSLSRSDRIPVSLELTGNWKYRIYLMKRSGQEVCTLYTPSLQSAFDVATVTIASLLPSYRTMIKNGTQIKRARNINLARIVFPVTS